MVRSVDQRNRLFTAGRRLADPAEELAQRITERVIDLVVNAVDLNAILAQVDLNAILDRVDVNAILNRVALDPILERVDVNALLARVDVDRLIERADVSAVVERVDVNAVMKRVDMDEIVAHTDLGAVIARSSGGVASEALDAARSQAVGLDGWVDRWVARLLRRKKPRPSAPGPSAATAEP